MVWTVIFFGNLTFILFTFHSYDNFIKFAVEKTDVGSFVILMEMGTKGLLTILMLVVSNVFMTFAWYGNLKLQEMKISTDWPLILIILFSWGIALLEYFFMIPANRIGSQINGGPFSLMQLKIIQEAVSLIVFTVIVATVFKGEPIRWNHLVSFIFIILAVIFAFWKR